MNITVSPSEVKGTIAAPASKSVMQRACAAALLKGGTTVLHNPGVSADDHAALNIIQQLGADVAWNEGIVTINSKGLQPKSSALNCGESGLSARMFTSIAALCSQPVSITGSGSLLVRPFHFFDQLFPQLNVGYKSNNGLLPLNVNGPLQPADIVIDGSLSSQFLSGLLFAYSYAGAKDVSISVENLSSKPYIDLTLQVMHDFDLCTPQNENYQQFSFNCASQQEEAKFSALKYEVEGDWSGAAFLLVAAAIKGEIKLRSLNPSSLQADRKIADVLQDCGADIELSNEGVVVKRNKLKSFRFNATDCPDLFPPLAVLAAFCEGNSIITGVNRLKHKESDRGKTLQEELGKLGINIHLNDNEMMIEGNSKPKSASVHSRGDHRIAMAAAVAALSADGAVEIEQAEAVEKSYPQFWEHLSILKS